MSLAQTLPPEILHEILTCLYHPIDWDTRLRQDPHDIYEEVATSPAKDPGAITPLKSASLVCKNWRRTAVRLLFRNAVWSFDRLEPPSEEETNLDNKVDFVAFLRRNYLAGCVQTLTMIVTYPEDLIGQAFVQLWNHGVLPKPDDGDHNIEKMRKLAGKFHHDRENLDPDEEETVVRWRPWENNWLWKYLFEHLDPTRITILASPANLCSAVGCWTDLGEIEDFEYTYWALSLSLSKGTSDSTNEPPQPSPRNPGGDETLRRAPCDLFSVRPWDSLVLNEGSSGLDHEGNPSVMRYLPTLLVPLLSSCDIDCNGTLLETLKSLSYIAVYPETIAIGTSLCEDLPPISNLYLQVAGKHADVDAGMLSECRRFYSFVVGAVYSPGPVPQSHWYSEPEEQPIPSASWQGLTKFEMGDVINGNHDHDEIWYGIKFMRRIFDLQSPGPFWKITAKGVLERGSHPFPKPGDAQDSELDD